MMLTIIRKHTISNRLKTVFMPVRPSFASISESIFPNFNHLPFINQTIFIMKCNTKKELEVAALENGTVIDHIPSNVLFKVVSILDLDQISNHITIGNNLVSKKLGKKGIIKIANKFFEPDEINKIAVIAPNVKLNIIRNYEVVEKNNVILPDTIIGIVKCSNPKCVTNNEPMKTRFTVLDKQNTILKCCYCERINKKNEIELI